MSVSQDDVMINGRPAEDWEVPLIEAARAATASRDAEVIDGIKPYATSPDAGKANGGAEARVGAKPRKKHGPYAAIGP